jgi:hypothetical protein
MAGIVIAARTANKEEEPGESRWDEEDASRIPGVSALNRREAP